MELTWSLVPLCVTALLAGAINAMAGGGTVLTFPALLGALAGMPGAVAAVIANGTSTVALVPGSLAGAWGYRRQVADMRRWLLLLAAPSVLGGAIGALLVTRLHPDTFKHLVPWLLLTAALLFLKESLWPRSHEIRSRDEKLSLRATLGLIGVQFLVSVYGGYFGAGIGILMLASLGAMRLGDIYRINALKNLLACGINGISAAVFIMDGKVAWRFALPMAISAIIGGYLGARLSLKVPPRYVRWLVVMIGLGLAAYYFVVGIG
ncbi:MAG: sulfite exporter TauE/SafE family protein [Planctomycetes bacterium]|nr:sulfite exporter TauE/SafE family protein [Planctomycetota bacterium]